MKLRTFVLWASLLVIGIAIGAVGSYYWNQQMRKAESALALDQANAAARKGDLDNAIMFAAQSYALYPDSALAGLMLKELIEKRAARTAPDSK